MILKHLNVKSLITALCMALPIAGCSEDGVEFGTTTVGWTAPTERADTNTLSLSEIGGYRVYYGTSPGNYTGRVDVLDGTATETTVTAIKGLYYYAITSFDTAGRESAYSLESSINI